MSTKITDLPVATELADDDAFIITDASDGLSKQVPASLVSGTPAPSNAPNFFSDFQVGDVAAWDTSSGLGTGVVGALTADNANADEGFGIWELATGANVGLARIQHGGPAEQTFRGSLPYVAEYRVKLPPTPSDVILSFGFDNDNLAPTNVCQLQADEGVGTWTLTVASVAGGGTDSEATATAAVAGWQTIRVEYDPASEARAYIDDVLIATVTNATAVPQGNDSMTAKLAIQKSVGPSVSMFVDWVRITGERA